MYPMLDGVDPALLPYAGLSPQDALWNLPALGTKVKILDKSSRFVPFVLNDAQRKVWLKIENLRYKKKKVRLLCLKARQQGISTLLCLDDFQKAAFHNGSRVQVMTHLDDTTSALYSMIQRYYDTLPGSSRWLPTSTYSQKGLEFTGSKSIVKVATAGSATVGHGTTITHFHGSEVSRWPNIALHWSGIMQAVPDTDGTSIVLESVAHGRGDAWHQAWQDSVSGDSDFDSIFVPWYLTGEYAKRPPEDTVFDDAEIAYAARFGLDDWQMYWRQRKIATDFQGDASVFGQMYPAYADEAFARSGKSLIQYQKVVEARARHCDPAGPLIFGYDPAAGGPDRSALIRRRGQKAYGLEFNKEADTMVQAGMLAERIQRENPAAVFIDATGASVGVSIVNRLHELNFKQVIPVGFATSADDDSKYVNKRAEIWYRMKEWLEVRHSSIPNDDSLEQDILAPNELETDSHERKRVESKKDMKKRGIRSPDAGDALALTFSFKVADREVQEMKRALSTSGGSVAKRPKVTH